MAALDDTYGAVFIGLIVASILYGFTCVQAWYYFLHYPSDRWHIKVLVAAVFLSDTLHQAIVSYSVYTYIITYYGVVDELTTLIWSMPSEVFPNATTTFLVQCFLAMRIYRLSNKNWIATGSAMLFVIADFVASMVYAIQSLPFTTFAQVVVLKPLSMSINILAAAGDLLIAGLLCYMLQTSRTGFRKSNTLINKLMIFSINTSLLTSICALASLVCIAVWPDSFAYIAFYFCIGRLYCNSLLATLNARNEIRSDSINDVSLSLQSRSAHRRTTHSTLGAPLQSMPNNIAIKIDTTHECISDEQYHNDVKDPVEAV